VNTDLLAGAVCVNKTNSRHFLCRLLPWKPRFQEWTLKKYVLKIATVQSSKLFRDPWGVPQPYF
jgi:hypothetical protein